MKTNMTSRRKKGYEVTFGRYGIPGRLPIHKKFRTKKAARAYINRVKHLFAHPLIKEVK